MPIFTLIGFDHVTRIRQLGNGWIEQKLFTWHLIHRVNCTEYLVGAQLWIEYLWRVYHNASCIHRLPNALLHAALGLVTSDYWAALLHPLFISSLDQWILLAMNPDCAFQELTLLKSHLQVRVISAVMRKYFAYDGCFWLCKSFDSSYCRLWFFRLFIYCFDPWSYLIFIICTFILSRLTGSIIFSNIDINIGN